MCAHDIDEEKENFLSVLLKAFFGKDFTSTGGITLDGRSDTFGNVKGGSV